MSFKMSADCWCLCPIVLPLCLSCAGVCAALSSVQSFPCWSPSIVLEGNCGVTAEASSAFSLSTFPWLLSDHAIVLPAMHGLPSADLSVLVFPSCIVLSSACAFLWLASLISFHLRGLRSQRSICSRPHGHSNIAATSPWLWSMIVS